MNKKVSAFCYNWKTKQTICNKFLYIIDDINGCSIGILKKDYLKLQDNPHHNCTFWMEDINSVFHEQPHSFQFLKTKKDSLTIERVNLVMNNLALKYSNYPNIKL